MAYVSFEPLKAWIAQQEDYERRNSRPAPLTDNERLALAVLVPVPPPPTPPPEQPVRPDVDLANVDCVSLLTRYASSKKNAYDPPVYTFEDVERLWQCRCTLPEEAPGMVFPGLDEDRKLSLFSGKKSAKQHAARRAVEWLMANGHMPTDGEAVVFPATSTRRSVVDFSASTSGGREPRAAYSVGEYAKSREATAQKSPSGSSPDQGKPVSKPPTPDGGIPRNTTPQQALPLPQRPSSAMQVDARPATASPARNVESMASGRTAPPPPPSSTPPAAATATMPPSTDVAAGEKRSVDPPATPTPTKKRIRGSPRANGGVNDEESMTNTEQLARLCEMFHLGTPKYELQSGQGENVFSGSVTLMAPAKQGKGDGRAIQLPSGVGVVENVYLKRPAKEKMAQSVLQYLRKNVLQLSGEAD